MCPHMMSIAPLQWFPANQQQLNDWLQQYKHPSEPAACAVFDWDNTCIFHDIGDATFHYQLETLALSMPPHMLANVVTAQIHGHADINGINVAKLRADILAAYDRLWPVMQSDARWQERNRIYTRDAMTLHDVHPIGTSSIQAWTTPPWHPSNPDVIIHAYSDFRAKLGTYYGLLRHLGGGLAYQWMTGLFAGTTPHGTEQLAIHAYHHAHQTTPPTVAQWQSATSGQSGHNTYTFATSIGPIDEMRQLMGAMRTHHIDVYVISASYEGLVRGLARHLNYPVQSDHIYGVRLTMADGYNTSTIVDSSVYPLPYRAGKVEMIRRFIPSPPAFVAGDADTDYEMLTAFAHTQLRLLINCNRTGVISSLYPLAYQQEQLGHGATTPPPSNGITLLQGRNDTQGCFHPYQSTVPLPQS